MDKYLSETVEVFKALGDYNRLRIIKLLQSQESLCVGMLSQKIGISQPAISQHLKILKSVGLIESEKIGYHNHYRIQWEQFKEINIQEILKRIPLEGESPETCEYNGEKQKCRELNE